MNEKTPKVAVVILSWNGKEFLQQFLPALLKTTYKDVVFYVADNASTDDSVAYVKAHFPSVKIIEIEKNEGFAQGYNVALQQVEAEYYVLLNQDVEVTPGWIEPVIHLMEQYPKIAVCQPKLRAYHEKDKFEYAGAAGGFLDKRGYAFCRGRFFHTTEKDTGQYDTASEIVWATGACMFIRSEIFQKLGGLDADFFAHFEEIDLCWRIKNAGYAVYYCPDSVVYHVGGGSLAQGNPKKTYLNYRNNMVTLVKNLKGISALHIIAFRLVLDVVSAFKSLLSGNWQDYLAICKAHFYFYFHILFILKKRRRTWQSVESNKVGPANNKAFYKGSIIWDFFVWRKKTFKELPEEDFVK